MPSLLLRALPSLAALPSMTRVRAYAAELFSLLLLMLALAAVVSALFRWIDGNWANMAPVFAVALGGTWFGWTLVRLFGWARTP